MKPDDKYYEKQTELETEKLKQKVNSLSQKDKQQIYEKGQIFHLMLGNSLPSAILSEVFREVVIGEVFVGHLQSSCLVQSF
jgi:hypothetical protein